MQVKKLLAPRRAVVDEIFPVFLCSAAVKRREYAEEVLDFGKVMRVWETMVRLAVDFCGVLICVDLQTSVNLNASSSRLHQKLTRAIYLPGSVGRLSLIGPPPARSITPIPASRIMWKRMARGIKMILQLNFLIVMLVRVWDKTF